jgi:hypothetical protein
MIQVVLLAIIALMVVVVVMVVMRLLVSLLWRERWGVAGAGITGSACR